MDSLTSVLETIFPCLPFGRVERRIQLATNTTKYQPISEKAAPQSSQFCGKNPRLDSDEAAASIVSAIMEADDLNPSLGIAIQSLVHKAGGWTEYLMTKILAALERVLMDGAPLKQPMQEAFDKVYEAMEEFEQFAADHPVVTGVFCTVIAVGILVLVAPYVVELLGFGELGPIEGTWAALWQSTYRGLVPKNSLFSFLQRLGMTWKHV